jgi:putative oxidoreductase
MLNIRHGACGDRMTEIGRRLVESQNMMHAIQSALTMLRAAQWVPVTAARILIGIFFCISGGTKLFVPAQFGVLQQTLVESHIPFPHANALFVAAVEFACGAGLALGLLTPLCAAMLAGDMLVAIATNRIHTIHASSFLAWLDDFLYLPEVLYMLILVWLIFSGPGRYSIDGLIAWPPGVER